MFHTFSSTIFVHKKITAPTAPKSAKTVIQVRDQGFEPWTP